MDYRDDMGGVGSFSRQNRTLYVGRIKETGPGPDTEQIVIRHFKEWGEIEKRAWPMFSSFERILNTSAVRVLQYRSVAFVTYVSELSAQFAKEAMACQSLDNDEILNVRWATEDPNPTSKVEEQARLEDVGARAIQERMDPKIVDAMRAVRALEDGDVLDDEGDVVPEGRRLGGQDDDEEEDEEEDVPDRKRRRIEAPAAEEPPKALGLLSADTMEGLKYFAEIRKRHAQPVSKAVAPSRPATLALGDYGSDED